MYYKADSALKQPFRGLTDCRKLKYRVHKGTCLYPHTQAYGQTNDVILCSIFVGVFCESGSVRKNFKKIAHIENFSLYGTFCNSRNYLPMLLIFIGL